MRSTGGVSCRQAAVFAFSCSLCWHVLSIPVLTLVWPDVLRPLSYPEIVFLGGIGPRGWSADLQEDSDSVSRVRKERLSGDKSDIIHKESIPLESWGRNAALHESPVVRSEIRATGDAAPGGERGVLYKPRLPELPDGANPGSNVYALELKCWILPDGSVETVENLVSSGVPEIDAIAERYIRNWQFVPLLHRESSDGEWAVITLEFRR